MVHIPLGFLGFMVSMIVLLSFVLRKAHASHKFTLDMSRQVAQGGLAPDLINDIRRSVRVQQMQYEYHAATNSRPSQEPREKVSCIIRSLVPVVVVPY